ncbi:MAG TPA: Rid family detoxifying hydrolase [Bacteroidota bacterium]|nr:Rid family detoxifying hydrolase [Bacteroidota bacterium]
MRRLVQEELAGMMQKEIVSPTKTIGPYSPAVRIGGFLFLSGQIGMDPATGTLVSTSFEAEVEQALRNVLAILRASGYDSSHVVSATVFLKNMNDFEKMNSVYARFFPVGAYPARTTVGVSELPRGANVEIAAVAYKPLQRRPANE